ncbi:Mitochondrial carrier protein ymc2 [Blastocladiella emersonii ATCC 22665]|nr:Mitochondrial carrier protein ymc2 [Blastocladiella emersonii ATCC 22665]
MTTSKSQEAAAGSSNQAVKEILAGSFGGVCQVLSGQPFDTIKVRLQTQPTPPIYSGVVDCVKKTVQADGALGLYKGTVTPLLGIGACVSIQFAVLENMKRRFAASNGGSTDLSLAQLYMAGAVSGVANSAVSGPVEHIRTRLQVQTGSNVQFKGPLDCVRQIYRGHGLAGVFKGQGVTVAREFQGYGAYFLTYEWLVQRACRAEGKSRQELPKWKIVSYGAVAGYSLWVSVFPVDVIKSKLQTDALDKANRKYSSALDCFQKTLRAEGVRGLYRGFVPCMLRAAPVNGITFLGFEAAMNAVVSKFGTIITSNLRVHGTVHAVVQLLPPGTHPADKSVPRTAVSIEERELGKFGFCGPKFLATRSADMVRSLSTALVRLSRRPLILERIEGETTPGPKSPAWRVVME